MLAGKPPKSKDILRKISHNRDLARPSENLAYFAHSPKKAAKQLAGWANEKRRRRFGR
jgi:hypothetical protein